MGSERSISGNSFLVEAGDVPVVGEALDTVELNRIEDGLAATDPVRQGTLPESIGFN